MYLNVLSEDSSHVSGDDISWYLTASKTLILSAPPYAKSFTGTPFRSKERTEMSPGKLYARNVLPCPLCP